MMFARVQLLNGFKKPLTYKIPTNLVGIPLQQKLVLVPLKQKNLPAMVIATFSSLPKSIIYEVRDIISVLPMPQDFNYDDFIKKVATFYFSQPTHFYKRIQSFLETDVEEKNFIESNRLHPDTEKKDIQLTDEQTIVVDYLLPHIKQPTYKPTLLHGVTGSGKTEIYKKLIQQAYEQGKITILLIPEVSLSLQFERLLKEQLPEITIFGFHSASTPKEKRAVWQSLLQQKPALIIGVHQPILLPIPHLGLIIVDEEHEGGFQEKKHPKINSKDIAIWRASHYNIPIILGSATPALNSLHNVEAQGWKFFQLKNRFKGAFPTIQKILLSKSQAVKRQFFWISRELEKAITNRLQKKEQIIIYLNRRGFSFFIQCKDCGFIVNCPNCSVSLTLHVKKIAKSTHRSQQQPQTTDLFKDHNKLNLDGLQQILRCHYCNHRQTCPPQCPSCNADEKNFLKKGIGTQQMVLMLRKLFPKARIERADLDTTSKKRSWQATVKKFEEGEIDILVGTQTLTKGYHFPHVTLVGIIWADLSLNIPNFRASEVTLQQIIQVAGRAGRHHDESLVILQIMQDNKLFDLVNEQNYLTFVDQERIIRKELSYPPFFRLICLEIRHSSAQEIDLDADFICKILIKTIEKDHLDIKLLGPTQPPVAKIHKTEIRHIFLKSPSFKALHQLITNFDLEKISSALFVIVH